MDGLDTLYDLAARLLDEARAAGADAADVKLGQSQSLHVNNQDGEIDEVESSHSFGMGLRVLVGKRQALVSGTDKRPDALRQLAQEAVARARLVPEDPYVGLPEHYDTPHEALGLDDPNPPSQAWLVEQANAMHDLLMQQAGVTGSEGTSAAHGTDLHLLANSHGFSGHMFSASTSLSASALAGEGAERMLDYDYDSRRQAASLRSAEAIALRAAERARARVGAAPRDGGELPLIFSNRVSSSLISGLVGAMNARAVVRGSSFLRDKMGEAVLPAAFDLWDVPNKLTGLASRAFDAEGQRPEPLALVSEGRLAAWLSDTATAAQLGLESTKRARRGLASPPSPGSTNLELRGPTTPLAELMADIKEGLFITEMMGQGLNPVTGDYSRGAGGFWIRDGQLAEPVNSMTVAGELLTMLSGLRMADDAEAHRVISCGSLRIDGMRIAGL